jgi:transposase
MRCAQESTQTTRVKIARAYRKHSDIRFQPARASRVAFASQARDKVADEPI